MVFERLSKIFICLFASFSGFIFATSPALALEDPTQASPTERVLLPPEASATNTQRIVNDELQGWDYLFDRLVSEGIDPAKAKSVLVDTRMPKFDSLIFSLTPKESRQLYRKFNTAKNRLNALKFYREHEAVFRTASSTFHVSPGVVLSILQIESGCGKNTGKARVFPALARLASASDPNNLQLNFEKKKADAVLQKKISMRAAWLEETFLPHAVDTFRIADQMGIHPLDLKGSGSGAIGLPQFLPGNVKRFGEDGNADGRIDVFAGPDAIMSVAHFLSSYGWNEEKNSTVRQKRNAIWEYNHSAPYIDTVMSMAQLLNQSLKTPTRPAPLLSLKKNG